MFSRNVLMIEDGRCSALKENGLVWLQQSRQARWYKLRSSRLHPEMGQEGRKSWCKRENFKAMREMAKSSTRLCVPPIPNTFLDLLMPSLTEHQLVKAIAGFQQEAVISLWSSQGHHLGQHHVFQRCWRLKTGLRWETQTASLFLAKRLTGN